MKKVMLFGALALGFMMSSCSDNTPSIVGTWIQPETNSTAEQGFELNKDGNMSLINMTGSYTSWEMLDSLLILKDDATQADTFLIDKLTDEDLVISESGFAIEFKRKIE